MHELPLESSHATDLSQRENDELLASGQEGFAQHLKLYKYPRQRETTIDTQV